jgi:outer membrane protein TolC
MKKRYRQGLLVLAGLMLWNQSIGSCQDLSLTQAIELAEQQNTGLKITQKGENLAAAALRQSRGAKSFSVTAASDYSRAQKSGSDLSAGLSSKVTVDLPVYSGGKLEAAVRRDEIGVKAADLTTKRAQENLKLSVITAYYDVLEAQKNQKVDQESVDNYQAHLTNVSQLYSAGSKARVDVLRSSVELSNARQTLIKAQNDYEIKVAILRNLLNLERDTALNLTDDFVYQPFPDTMPVCLDHALQQRKDLQVDVYTLEQKKQALKIAKAGSLPTVGLSLGTGLDNQYSPQNDNSHSFTVGVNLSWNLFDSGVTRGQTDAAIAQRDAAKLTLDKAREDIDLAVRQDYYNMREAEKRFTSTSDAVNQAKEDYMIARERYRAGEGMMLDIIDAQLALSTAELNAISAQYDYARNKAALENAIGI